jgi:hypothetical protein
MEVFMYVDPHEGLTLTHCDSCGSRQWCAVEGSALCRRCCPSAVEEAQAEARTLRVQREAAKDLPPWAQELPPRESDPTPNPVPWAQVRHLFGW